jgi:ribose 5-phosphate isomerase B
VEDDNLNILCIGGRATGIAVAWDCTKNFLSASFSGADRHRRRLAKVTQLESSTVARAKEFQAVEPE